MLVSDKHHHDRSIISMLFSCSTKFLSDMIVGMASGVFSQSRPFSPTVRTQGFIVHPSVRYTYGKILSALISCTEWLSHSSSKINEKKRRPWYTLSRRFSFCLRSYNSNWDTHAPSSFEDKGMTTEALTLRFSKRGLPLRGSFIIQFELCSSWNEDFQSDTIKIRVRKGVIEQWSTPSDNDHSW